MTTISFDNTADARALRDMLAYTVDYGYMVSIEVSDNGEVTFTSDRSSLAPVVINHVPAEELAKVQNGVRFLNQRVPNWRSLVTEPIDIVGGTDCILGQVFKPMVSVYSDDDGWENGFGVGLRVLGINWDEAREFGFVVNGEHAHGFNREWAAQL